MLGWFRKQAAKIFHSQQGGRVARSVDQCLFELAELRQELNRQLTERTWSVDKIVIERLQADKVELNLGSIDIRELSGMLSIGFNYGGKLIKMDSHPLEGQGRQKTPAAPRGVTPVDKSGANRPGACRPKAARQPGEPPPESEGAAAKARPRLTINFR
jgi:hypothetical protein